MNDQTLTTAPAGADRRGFLRRAGTVTAVAAVAAGARPTLASAATVQPSTTREDLTSAATSVGAHLFYVKDAARGQIAILVGEREVVYTDKPLALALLTAAGR